MTKGKPKPNYIALLPNGEAISVYIKNIELAKDVLLKMSNRVRLIRIKR